MTAFPAGRAPDHEQRQLLGGPDDREHGGGGVAGQRQDVPLHNRRRTWSLTSTDTSPRARTSSRCHHVDWSIRVPLSAPHQGAGRQHVQGASDRRLRNPGRCRGSLIEPHRRSPESAGSSLRSPADPEADCEHAQYLSGQTIATPRSPRRGAMGTCASTPRPPPTSWWMWPGGSLPTRTSFSSPERLLDTRSGGAPPAGSSRPPLWSSKVTEVGSSNIPDDAGAVVLNVSSQWTEHRLGHGLSVRRSAPHGQQPQLHQGVTIANAVISKVGAGGKVCLYTEKSTHLLVDVNGWFPRT